MSLINYNKRKIRLLFILFFAIEMKCTQITGQNLYNAPCEICNCTPIQINCQAKQLTDHFDNSSTININMTRAVFSFNQLIHLKAFPKLPFKILQLDHCKIATIDTAAFLQLENLNELDLSHNHLTSDRLLPDIFTGEYYAGYFNPLFSLETLFLDGNALHTLHQDLFEHLPNIKYLSLSGNPFTVIDYVTIIAISSLHRLQELNLADTMLSEIPATMLHTPRNLIKLDLSSNYFNHIPISLGEAINLETLNFDNNPITEINTFPILSKLKVLKIQNMINLLKIGPHAFSNLTSLEEFFCTHNGFLSYISETAFSINNINPEEGQTYIKLKKLYLSFNNLEYLQSTMVGRWEDLLVIDLQMNPWACDCENQWMVDVLIPILKKRDVNRLQLICNKPEELLGTTLLSISQSNSSMRCMDYFGHHPENDGKILIGVLIGGLFAIPITIVVLIIIKKILHRNNRYTAHIHYRRTVSDDIY